MNSTDLVQNLALLAPGFIALKILDLFGGQHRRLEWEWVVWSVVISLPIAGLAWAIRQVLGFWLPEPTQTDAVELVCRFLVAAGVGAVAAGAWWTLKRSHARLPQRVVRWLSDSAWDVILDEAVRDNCGVAVDVTEGGRAVAYYGDLTAFGYETAGAEPWLYLTHVQRSKGRGNSYRPIDARTRGMLVHKDEITRIRLVDQSEPAV
jgi:hypothetical protein